MKLNKIKARCLERKHFSIVDGPDGVQWFSNDSSLWLCIGIHIERENLPELFGLSPKQVKKCIFSAIKEQGDEYGIAMTDGEPELDYMGDVWDYEQQIMAFRSAEGLLFVTRSAAEPCNIEGETAFTLRMYEDDDGKRYPMVALYRGMICEALLRAVDLPYADAIVKRLARLGDIPAWTGEEVSENEAAAVKAG